MIKLLFRNFVFGAVVYAVGHYVVKAFEKGADKQRTEPYEHDGKGAIDGCVVRETVS